MLSCGLVFLFWSSIPVLSCGLSSHFVRSFHKFPTVTCFISPFSSKAFRAPSLILLPPCRRLLRHSCALTLSLVLPLGRPLSFIRAHPGPHRDFPYHTPARTTVVGDALWGALALTTELLEQCVLLALSWL